MFSASSAPSRWASRVIWPKYSRNRSWKVGTPRSPGALSPTLALTPRQRPPRPTGLVQHRKRPPPGVTAFSKTALPLDFAADELLDGITGGRVVVLLRRRLHEVRRGRQDRAADTAVERDLRG